MPHWRSKRKYFQKGKNSQWAFLGMTLKGHLPFDVKANLPHLKHQGICFACFSPLTTNSIYFHYCLPFSKEHKLLGWFPSFSCFSSSRTFLFGSKVLKTVIFHNCFHAATTGLSQKYKANWIFYFVTVIALVSGCLWRWFLHCSDMYENQSPFCTSWHPLDSALCAAKLIVKAHLYLTDLGHLVPTLCLKHYDRHGWVGPRAKSTKYKDVTWSFTFIVQKYR